MKLHLVIIIYSNRQWLPLDQVRWSPLGQDGRVNPSRGPPSVCFVHTSTSHLTIISQYENTFHAADERFCLPFLPYYSKVITNFLLGASLFFFGTIHQKKGLWMKNIDYLN